MLIAALNDSLRQLGPANVLVKGSRSARMERVIAALSADESGGGRH